MMTAVAKRRYSAGWHLLILLCRRRCYENDLRGGRVRFFCSEGCMFPSISYGILMRLPFANMTDN